MGINLDANVITKGMETVNNLTKVAANLTDNKQQKPEPQKPDHNNQPHNQTVEVKVGETNPSQSKPMVIREKSETHIHKTFPDQRELSARECEVETLRLKNEHELKMKELDFHMNTEAMNRKDRLEREEYERKERERRRERERKTARKICIGCCIAGVVAVGFAAYDFYTGSRNPEDRKLFLRASNPVKTEGTVK